MGPEAVVRYDAHLVATGEPEQSPSLVWRVFRLPHNCCPLAQQVLHDIQWDSGSANFVNSFDAYGGRAHGHPPVAHRYVTDGAMRESARADGVRDPELVNDINVQRAARLRLYSPGERCSRDRSAHVSA